MRVQRHAPAALYPRERPGTPLYRRLGGPQGQSGQVREISPPPGFDPRTFQPVASLYTDYATQPTQWTTGLCNKFYTSLRVMKTNLIQCLSEDYFVNQPLHVSGISVAHHQEVYCTYTTFGRCCAGKRVVENYLTFWRRNYFFLILAHPVYKM